MKFGTLPIDDAAGALLAHSLPTAAGVFKKGRLLTAADLHAIRAAGITHVIAARLDASDTPEDEAAHLIARALAGPGVTVSAPFTGRCNIFASTNGLAQLDVEALHALNARDERITVATLAAFERVTPGQMLATIKIIPFAVPSSVVAAAIAQIRTAPSPAIGVAPLAARRAALILTRLPGTKPSIIDKRTRVIADRLTARGSRLGETITVAHDEAAVAVSLNDALRAGCDPILVFAASAIVDRGDVIPAALLRAGGTITRLGMPVDPGNLLLLGRLGASTVIGVPSCAASPKLNGFDWVLDRVLAGVNVSSTAIGEMGVGGLLKEIPTRPQPRDGAHDGATRRAPRLACLVLAAGRSTRMGDTNKLLADVRGTPMVRHVVEAALASAVATVSVVTGHEGARVQAALAGLDVTIIANPAYASGLASSLRAGLAALGPDIDGVFVALGDMPDIEPEHFNRLAAAFAPDDNRAIVVPMRHGRRGNPVLWARTFFADMSRVTGDTGAKDLLTTHADHVAEVDLATDAVITDIDTPDALAALRERGR
jgi:molybdenum cofactor cytidylyltransferase